MYTIKLAKDSRTLQIFSKSPKVTYWSIILITSHLFKWAVGAETNRLPLLVCPQVISISYLAKKCQMQAAASLPEFSGDGAVFCCQSVPPWQNATFCSLELDFFEKIWYSIFVAFVIKGKNLMNRWRGKGMHFYDTEKNLPWGNCSSGGVTAGCDRLRKVVSC